MGRGVKNVFLIGDALNGCSLIDWSSQHSLSNTSHYPVLNSDVKFYIECHFKSLS